jgi:hypothetical protein
MTVQVFREDRYRIHDCATCGRPVQDGTRIVYRRINSRGNHRTLIHHVECFVDAHGEPIFA